MTVQLPTDKKFTITTGEIRMFMRDQPKYNILLDDVEFSDDDIQLAMNLAVAKWNVIPPMSNLNDPRMLPEWILLCGVCCILLRSEGIRQKRNQMMTRDGNIEPVGLDEKEAIYMKWAQLFCDEFERLSQGIKIQQNMESILGSGPSADNYLRSGYRYIGKYTL